MGAVNRAALRCRPFAAGVAGLAFLSAPVAAQAQSCDTLRSAYANADGIAQSLMDQNPGIRLIVFGCLSTAKGVPQSDIGKVFATCGGAGCMFISGSYGNCIATGSRMLASAMHAIHLKDQMQRRGCL